MRRTLSAILSLAMILSLFTFLGVMNVAAEIKAISNTSPAITAEVGDTVDFSADEKSIQFCGQPPYVKSVLRHLLSPLFLRRCRKLRCG